MSTQKTFLPLFSALVLGAMVAPQANASLVYSAKFVCGAVPFELPTTGGGPVPTAPVVPPPLPPMVSPTEKDAVVGVYLTAINIHNPQNFAVTFMKKVVQASEEPSQGLVKPNPPLSETLKADGAEYVDCSVIWGLLGITTPQHIEGFVVLEVPENQNTGAFNFLDVVGKYTARSPDIGVYSPALEIVVYPPTIIQ
jgi:hypothetical protein